MKARKGATFLEYALLAGLVAIVVAIAVTVFGKDIKALFSDTAKQTETVDAGVKSVKLDGGFSSESESK